MATSSTSSSSRSWQWWVNAVAFVSLVIIGIVLLLSQLGLSGDIPDILRTIANALAYVVVAACSFVYVSGKMRRKGGFWYMIIWAVGVILITIAIIIPLFK